MGKTHKYNFCQTQHFCATFCGNIPHFQNGPFHATSTNQQTNKSAN